MTQVNRIAAESRIDRSQPVTFQFNGKSYRGFKGDTLASALLANGVDVVGRSFKYSRPRGIVAAGAEEPNAIFQIGATEATQVPNVRGTQQELFNGLVGQSTNGWPNVETDVMGIIGKVGGSMMPPGFYYKTFMYPKSMWETYEKFIRRAAGLGRFSTGKRSGSLRKRKPVLRCSGCRCRPCWSDGSSGCSTQRRTCNSG
ncbi:2Fe-2S iron-sulfur cluster-binding protein [Vibrio sp. CDRSL-10 TSBA]